MSADSPPSTPPPPKYPEGTMDTHARSIVYLGHEKSPSYVIESTRLPAKLAPGEVMVRMELATICGSDMHTIDGRRTLDQPCVLGHEGSGVVVRSARAGLEPGQRVTWAVCSSCNACFLCSVALQNKCSSLVKCGFTPVTTSVFGTYSSHLVCPPGCPVVPLPAALTPALAAPLNCALATMVNAVSALPSWPAPGQPGANVALVQGAGMLGAYGVALLREAGYSRVLCLDTNRARLAKVREFGAIPVHDEDMIETGAVDAVIEVCGNKAVWEGGLRALRTGGTYVLVGLVHPDSKLDLTAFQVIFRCLTIRGVHNYTEKHLRQAVDFVAKHHQRYPFASLLGPTYPLSEFKAAVEVARSGKFFRVGVNPQQ